MSADAHRRIIYCPMHEEKPKLPRHQDPLKMIVALPRICLSCQAKNSAMTAELKAAGLVQIIPIGVSALDDMESVYNPHRIKKLRAKNSKNHSP